jgi:hypothetical protein
MMPKLMAPMDARALTHRSQHGSTASKHACGLGASGSQHIQEVLGGSDVIVARDIEVALKREDLVDVITGSKRSA